jgi:3,4-dihydroxy-2-butanone 4-phosphate synthase
MDEEVNLVNQREARVYKQLPSYSQMAHLGDKVGFSLTLDEEKVTAGINAADRDARQIILQRQAELQEAETDAPQEAIMVE